MEIWKSVCGFEGLYEVSSEGRVRSRRTCSLITQKKHNRGYLQVSLFKKGTEHTCLVHRLVAEAFIPTENNNLTVNHIDENPHNNRAENLEWCSLTDNIRKYNANHPDKVGRSENMTPVHQIDKNGNIVKLWKSVAEIRRNLNYNAWSISQCCNNKRKTAYGYQWRYAI